MEGTDIAGGLKEGGELQVCGQWRSKAMDGEPCHALEGDQE